MYRSLQNYFRSLKARGIFDASDLKTKECQPPVSDENNRSPKTFVPILIHLTGGPKPAALSDQEQLVSTKFATAKLAMATICSKYSKIKRGYTNSFGEGVGYEKANDFGHSRAG